MLASIELGSPRISLRAVNAPSLAREAACLVVTAGCALEALQSIQALHLQGLAGSAGLAAQVVDRIQGMPDHPQALAP